MCPSEWRDVSQKMCGAVQTLTFSARYGLAEVLGVPINYDGGEQVQPCHAEVLGLGSE
jgi:hypothetical protein